ncbi:MAG: type II toxin-antitoxin system VapC family toxin [Betaproteobacteria bacterium]
MIGVDTNVIVRYIMQDDAAQSRLATRLIESLTADNPGFVPLVAITELSWVLSASYGLERDEVVTVMELLLRTKELRVEAAPIVWGALRTFRDTSADFADCLIERSAASAGCAQTMTFDRVAARDSGMTLIH